MVAAESPHSIVQTHNQNGTMAMTQPPTVVIKTNRFCSDITNIISDVTTKAIGDVNLSKWRCCGHQLDGMALLFQQEH